MSRLGKLPIKLEKGAKAKIEKDFLIVTGPKGELKQKLHALAKVEVSEAEINVSVANKDVKEQRAFWGLYWSLIRNMVIGVTDGYERKLEVIGVGYKAAVNATGLLISAGYSHPVDFKLPKEVTARVEANVIILNSADKQLVGEMAAQIRKIRKPEPYKGKGIKYAEEVIRRKAGKTAGKGDK